VNVLTRGAVRAWYAAGAEGFAWIPRPSGGPLVSVAGPDALQVLLLGGGPAVGWGVATHELGLAGAMAREVSRQTGRGVDVLTVADHTIDIRSAGPAMQGLDLRSFDCVVLTLGVEDVVKGVRPARWSRQLTQLLDEMRGAASVGTHIVVAGIQPVRSIPVYDHPLADALTDEARRLNVLTASICAGRAQTTFVPLPADPANPPGPRRTPKNYPYFGSLLGLAIAGRIGTPDSVRLVDVHVS
jgi:hypothetical protein